MIEQISWSFTIPVFAILVLLCVILWLVQDRNATIKALRKLQKFTQRDLEGATDAEDFAYYQGLIEAYKHAEKMIVGGPDK